MSRYPLATRSDIQKARDTIQRLRKENACLKMKAHLAQSHVDGLRAEVAELRRRLGLPTPPKRDIQL